MNNTMILVPITQTYYESEASLLQQIDAKLRLYLSIPQVFQLYEVCGLRPSFMLDPDHPAYLPDIIAEHCLCTYDPSEKEDIALERCITDKIHHYTVLMKIADLSKVCQGNADWEQYGLDFLLRFVWRHLGDNLMIPLYLDKKARLADPFLLEIKGDTVVLTQCTLCQTYEVDTNDMDYSTFFAHMCHQFQLATESYGYFVPAFVWLCPDNFTKGGAI